MKRSFNFVAASIFRYGKHLATLDGRVQALRQLPYPKAALVATAVGAARQPTNDPLVLQVEAFRQRLLVNDQQLEMEDYGAGSLAGGLGAGGATKTIVVRKMAAAASTTPTNGWILYHLIRELQPVNCLELGTCFGISAGYQLAALLPSAKLTTLEGATRIAAIATDNLNTLAKPQFTVVQGPFSKTLPHLLQTLGPIDFAFIDGHHNGAATVGYFEQLLPHLQPQAVLVFDDISWSPDMHNAWVQLQQHPSVAFTLDLFGWGIAGLR